MSEILDKLFGSAARVKIIRLFLLNPESMFTSKEIERRCRVSGSTTRKEINLLKKIDFIKQKVESVDSLIKLKNGKIKNNKKKVTGLRLNESFPLLRALQVMLLKSAPIDRAKMLRMFKAVGKMKLIILSGVFIQSSDSRVDLFLVGSSIKNASLERVLKKIEAEIGKELSYVAFDTKEFVYRLGMYDRFVRDVLDYPHEKILNKLEI